jgi:transposase
MIALVTFPQPWPIQGFIEAALSPLPQFQGHCHVATRPVGSISKQGDRYLRSLFTAGALAVIRYAKIHGTDHRPWLTRLLARRPTKVAAIALANKLARMAWAMMARNESYKEPAALTA